MLFSLRKLLHTFRFFNGYIDWSWKYPRLLRKFQSYSLQLRALRGSAAGRRVFIVGSGPSLKQTDLSALAGHVVIAVNSSYKFLLENGINPDYLLIEDRFTAVNIARSNDLRLLGPTKVLISLNNSDLRFQGLPLFYLTNYPADRKYFEQGIQFSKNFHSLAFLGGAIVFQALQFAYFLSAREVWLLGIDFNYGEKFIEKYKSLQGTTISLTEEDISLIEEAYFSKSYQKFNPGDKFNIPDWTIQISAFSIARDVMFSEGIAVINGTPNTKLGVFEKKPLRMQ